MKPTQALTAVGSLVLAGALASGCTPAARDTPSQTPPAAPAPASPSPTQADDCEDTDFAEGDWLADCLGLGDPEDENEDGHGSTPSKGKPSKTKPGSPAKSKR